MARLIISGTRDLRPDLSLITRYVREMALSLPSDWEFGHKDESIIECVLCGCAGGVDMCGLNWARKKNIPVEFFPAGSLQKRWAGPVALVGDTVHKPMSVKATSEAVAMSGRAMIDSATHALIFWDGKCRRAENLIEMAEVAKLKGIWRIA
jgi:hypothetical protein